MSIEKLLELHDKQVELRSAWNRNMLSLAAAGLALLAGLNPQAASLLTQFLLSGTWLCLGSGIVSAAASTYLEVDRARSLAEVYKAQLLQNLQERGTSEVTEFVASNPKKIYSVARYVMVVSLLCAVVLLVLYSILRTVGF